MEPEDIHELEEIQKNYPRDTSMCCTKMFQLWLDKQPDASWGHFIQALKESNIELNELASAIEQRSQSQEVNLKGKFLSVVINTA